MFQLARPLFITCETPLHAGSGDSLGIVDLPIQRERHTSFPKIEASSLKGALREAFEQDKKKVSPSDIIKAFGPDTNASEHAGALGFTDARLLLFPVKSMKGVFAWITCPKALRQLQTDLALAKDSPKLELTNIAPKDGECIALAEGLCDVVNKGKVILEEYCFTRIDDDAKKPIAKFENAMLLHFWLAKNAFGSTDDYWKEKAKNSIIL